VTLLANPGNPNATPFSQFIEKAGRSAAIETTTALVTNSAEIEAVIAKTAARPGGGLLVSPDSLLINHRDEIIAFAALHRLPAIYPLRIFAASGGLVSYDLDFPQLFRQAADYVGRILKGEKPADLPVVQPTKFELVINLKIAKTLGMAVPQALLVAADEVIE
jgi:putative ABC transport system substrate-binding protein